MVIGDATFTERKLVGRALLKEILTLATPAGRRHRHRIDQRLHPVKLAARDKGSMDIRQTARDSDLSCKPLVIEEGPVKRQARPFVVEVKQKRTHPKQSHSIWGDLDLSAIIAETTSGAGEGRLPKRQLIDSGIIPVDVEFGQQQRAEHLMADPNEAEPVQTGSERPAKVGTDEVKKKAPRPKKAKAQPKRSVAKEAAKPMVSASESPVRAKTPRKIHSDKERTQKLGQITKSIGRGESVKSATQQAGISEQTYYQWKRTAVPASKSGDLKDLLALEEENERLKSLLAARLRKENAELKKRLGLG